MSRITLGEIKTLALAAADAQNDYDADADTGHITNTALTYWINAELAELHDLLAASFEEYFFASRTVPITSGVNHVSLPEDCYKILDVYININNTYRRIKKFLLNSQARLLNVNASTLYQMWYRIAGTDMHLLPPPSENSEIIIDYVPQYRKLEYNDDEISLAVPTLWEDVAIQGVAARIAVKKEEDSSPFLQQKILGHQRIKDTSANRDTGNPLDAYDINDGGRRGYESLFEIEWEMYADRPYRKVM